MSTLDIVLLCFIAVPALAGVFYGFLNIIFSLLSWVLSIIISIKLLPYFSPLFETYIETFWLRNSIVFTGLFIISLLLISIISFFIVKLLGRTGLTSTDRILGLIFGSGLGFTLAAFIVFISGFTFFPMESWWNESKLIRPFENIGVWSAKYLPESFQEYHSYTKLKNE